MKSYFKIDVSREKSENSSLIGGYQLSLKESLVDGDLDDLIESLPTFGLPQLSYVNSPVGINNFIGKSGIEDNGIDIYKFLFLASCLVNVNNSKVYKVVNDHLVCVIPTPFESMSHMTFSEEAVVEASVVVKIEETPKITDDFDLVESLEPSSPSPIGLSIEVEAPKVEAPKVEAAKPAAKSVVIPPAKK